MPRSLVHRAFLAPRAIGALLGVAALVLLTSTNLARAGQLIVDAPPLPGVPQAGLWSASCPSASDCMAVGVSYRHATGAALSEQLRGDRWSILPFPTGNENAALASVTCLSSRSCVAVGVVTLKHIDRPLVARWDGSQWTLEKIQGPGSPGSPDSASLWGVSCPARHSCFAAGADEDLASALVEHWNGHRWSAMRLPETDDDVELNGISCASAHSCVAVGDDFTGCQTPFAERWNGTSWSLASMPAIPQFGGSGPYPCGRLNDSTLAGASCASSGSCVLVGWLGVSGTFNDVPLVESAQSTATPWLMDGFPPVNHMVDPQGGGGYLEGVACRSAGVCTAVGAAASGNRSVAIVADLRLHRWSVRRVATKLSDPQLNGISCPTRSSCLVVGFGSDKHNNQIPLAMRVK